MAAAKTKKRSIIIGNKEYTMPQKMSTMAYLHYLTALWTQKRNGRCTQDSSSWT